MWQLFTGLFWTGFGFAVSYWMPSSAPKRLGKLLYWVGVPLQVFVLSHQSDFEEAPWLPPLTTICILIAGWGMALLCMRGMKTLKEFWLMSQRLYRSTRYEQKSILVTSNSLFQQFRLSFIGYFSQYWPQHKPAQGSFVLASVLGNTGFIGLAIAPPLVHPAYLGWIVIYGIVHNVMGSYGLGVLVAHHFGTSFKQPSIINQFLVILSVPTLWAFFIGCFSQPIQFSHFTEKILQSSSSLVVPGAFLLIGMQLMKLRSTQGIQLAFLPSMIKMLILPGLAGIGLTLMGVHGDARLALVLMSGMPTAFANLILAEEYNLDRQIAAGSILISTIGLPLLIPVWLSIFR
jgi:malate permease and related proteins